MNSMRSRTAAFFSGLSDQPEVARHGVRKHAIETRLVERIHPSENSAEHGAVFSHHRPVAILIERLLRDVHLIAGKASALKRAARHPVDAPVSVIGAARAVLAER